MPIKGDQFSSSAWEIILLATVPRNMTFRFSTDHCPLRAKLFQFKSAARRLIAHFEPPIIREPTNQLATLARRAAEGS
jgi:hypothetical protein